MRKKFSVKWKASKQARKQRKYRANAPLHIRRKFMSANLSKELRKKYSRRSFPVRKGDIVKLMKGSFKGKQGKIVEINLDKLRVSVEGLQRQKKDGTKVNASFSPSCTQIIELNLDDKKRIAALERKGQGRKEKEQNKQDKKLIDKEKKNALEKK